jgi:tetratricopeptide (TPR) repeat protein
MQSPDDNRPLAAEPLDYADYYRQGWDHHVKREEEPAEASLRKALALEPESVDANYVLGLVLKSQQRGKEAIESFERVLDLLDQNKVEDRTRSAMLRRLAKGHINHLKTGDWNLEKEIWQRKGEGNP